MNYKISTYVLLVALVGFIIYSCGSGDQTDADDGSTSRTASQNEDEIDADLKAEMKKGIKVDPNTGGFIRVDSAYFQSDRFRRHRGNNAQFKRDPYGFGFGLNKLKELIANIDTLNSHMNAADTNKITGVRIFMIRRHSDTPTGKKPHVDLLMVPCRASGFNFIPIGDPTFGKKELEAFDLDENPGLLLNTSSPCPDLCDSTKK